MGYTFKCFFLLLVCLYGNAEGGEVCQANDLRAVVTMIRQVKTDTHDTMSLMQSQIQTLTSKMAALEKRNDENKEEIKDLKSEIRNLTQASQVLLLVEHITRRYSIFLGNSSSTQCDDGWLAYLDSRYLFSEKLMTFNDAQDYCKQHNASLIHVNDLGENEFVKSILVDAKATQSWIGLWDYDNEGQWRWVNDNSILEYSDWGPNEPTDTGGNEDCVIFYQLFQYKWNDVPCDSPYKPICEKK